jgi:hypothetical protein
MTENKKNEREKSFLVLKKTAVELLESYKKRINRDYISDKHKEELWETILQDTLKQKSGNKKIVFLSISSVAAAACIILGFFFSKNHPQDALLEYASHSDYDINIQDVRLIKSDVALSIPDGNLEYDSTGIIRTESEKNICNPKISDKIGNPDNRQQEYDELIVPKGKQMRLVLSDGSKVIINSGSRLVYPPVFGEDKRELYIEGEAYFDVAKNPHSPFIIKTGHLFINVLGTSFNVSAYKDKEPNIVLVNGKVGVTCKNAEAVELAPNDMAYLHEDRICKKVVNVYKHICWTKQEMLLESDPLDIVLEKLSLYYGETITCEDELKNISISGKLNLRDDMSGTLHIISSATHIPVIIEKNEEKIVFKKSNN